MRTTDRLRRRIFPTLLTPIEKAMLSELSHASGLSRGGVIRELIFRETANRKLAKKGGR